MAAGSNRQEDQSAQRVTDSHGQCMQQQRQQQQQHVQYVDSRDEAICVASFEKNGNRERQEAQLPDLVKAIADVEKEAHKGIFWPDHSNKSYQDHACAVSEKLVHEEVPGKY